MDANVKKTEVAQAVEYHLVGAASYSIIGRGRWNVGTKYECTPEVWSELRTLRTEGGKDPMFLPWGQELKAPDPVAMSDEPTGKITIHHEHAPSDAELAGLENATSLQDLLEDGTERTVDLSDLDDDAAEVALRGGTPGEITTVHTEASEDEGDGDEGTDDTGEQDTGEEQGEDHVEEVGSTEADAKPKRVTSLRRPARVVVKGAKAPAAPAGDDEQVEV